MLWIRCTVIVCVLRLGIWSGGADDRDPNILLLVADDLGYGELGCQGVTRDIPTPRIDSIAANGVRFTQGYVTAPYCAASRAGLLTGRMQTRFGFEFNPIGAGNEDPEAGLPTRERTLATVLREERGYATSLVGKWHLGGTAKFSPLRRGFDEFFGFLHEGHYFVPSPYEGMTTWLRRRRLPGGASEGRWVSSDGRTILSAHMGYTEPDYDADNPIYRQGQPVEETEYLTDAFTREAVSFIDRHQDRPFFLMVAYNAVHSPLQAPTSEMTRFRNIEDIQRRIFAGMLARMDASVGAILDRLRDLELESETLVFFISDNGGPTRELTSSNAPLRGEKGQVYEGGLRVPFLAQWQGTLPAGVEYHLPVSTLDIFATSLAASNLESSVLRKPIDGVDLAPFVTGKRSDSPHETLFWRLGASRTALRQGDWKLVRQRGDWELYDIASDPSETLDRAASASETTQTLISTWREWDSEMVEPVF